PKRQTLSTRPLSGKARAAHNELTFGPVADGRRQPTLPGGYAMSRRGRCMIGLIAVSLCLALGRGVGAVAPEVKDDAKLFTDEAIKKANDQIREIAQKYDRDLLVETFASVPADEVENVKKMDKEERGKFFEKWANERAKFRAVNGVYVLICKE